MPTLKHSCETCDSTFTVNYDEELCEDAPHYCPFCGDYIIEDDYVEEDEE
jgi:predicted  nucleic acid-binding Zn-ribbon protein